MTTDDGISITVHLETDVEMTVGDVWPDGDEPDEITAEAVAAVMEAGGYKDRVLRDWMLLEDLDVDVSVDRPNPAWHQDETLTGEPAPPRWLRSSSRPWERIFASAAVAQEVKTP